jgi:hypothetical protein
MSDEQEDTTYTPLSDEDRSKVKQRLLAVHEHLFHGTPAANLDSIRQHGLHPRFESVHSAYANRDREPGAAIRYCIKNHPELALSAAGNRSQEWDEAAEGWVPVSPEIAILRVKAAALLNRPFGLDHSFGEVAGEVEAVLKSRHRLTPDDFVGLVEKYGSISCYACIPPGELEICTDAPPSLAGKFSKL